MSIAPTPIANYAGWFTEQLDALEAIQIAGGQSAKIGFVSQHGLRFVYHFLDEQYDQLYRKEERLGRMLGVFSLLVIVVGCGGIFALAASAAQQRTKEIGVRKVLGATVTQIALLLSREFTWLVVAANIVAFPVVYWATRSWLSEFTYPVSLGPGHPCPGVAEVRVNDDGHLGLLDTGRSGVGQARTTRHQSDGEHKGNNGLHIQQLLMRRAAWSCHGTSCLSV